MNFDFSDDQKQIKDQARKFLSEKCTTKTVRQALRRKRGLRPRRCGSRSRRWMDRHRDPRKSSADWVWAISSSASSRRELGRALAPVPFSSTVYLFAEALLAAGTDEQKKRLLPKVASGEAIGCLARSEGPGAVAAQDQSRQLQGRQAFRHQDRGRGRHGRGLRPFRARARVGRSRRARLAACARRSQRRGASRGARCRRSIRRAEPQS